MKESDMLDVAKMITYRSQKKITARAYKSHGIEKARSHI